MPSVTPYLNFSGNCEEAIEFYKEALQGELLSVVRFRDMPGQEVPAEMADKIMHCVLVADDVIIMASDAITDTQRQGSSSISLSLDFESEDEQTETFDALAVGGTVTMALQEAPWGARFGMLTDKYGVSWLFNYDEDQDDEDEDEGEF